MYKRRLTLYMLRVDLRGALSPIWHHTLNPLGYGLRDFNPLEAQTDSLSHQTKHGVHLTCACTALRKSCVSLCAQVNDALVCAEIDAMVAQEAKEATHITSLRWLGGSTSPMWCSCVPRIVRAGVRVRCFYHLILGKVAEG